MRESNIICRKYWNPLITDHKIYFDMSYGSLVNAKKLTDSVLCLPIYPKMDKTNFERIVEVLKHV